MRHKPMYNDMNLIYKDLDDVEWPFQCNEVTSSKQVAILINQPIKDAGSRYITDSDIDFVIDGELIDGDFIKRITDIPELKPVKDNNTRRGVYRKIKVLVTT